ncbi:hypothetical protein XELAEV_18004678mg [Xenopus laevis]|uniref:Uncharacterized protein n=1 Tax=Xenopus laevis TaxID=8355 RepID=A0A974BQU4_XENLA|nr:hypothetical protein XELAEV_18004678mg [Xenopus laevis]
MAPKHLYPGVCQSSLTVQTSRQTYTMRCRKVVLMRKTIQILTLKWSGVNLRWQHISEPCDRPVLRPVLVDRKCTELLSQERRRRC